MSVYIACLYIIFISHNSYNCKYLLKVGKYKKTICIMHISQPMKLDFHFAMHYAFIIFLHRFIARRFFLGFCFSFVSNSGKWQLNRLLFCYGDSVTNGKHKIMNRISNPPTKIILNFNGFVSSQSCTKRNQPRLQQ